MHEERFLYAANVENLIFYNNRYLENGAWKAGYRRRSDWGKVQEY